MALMIGCIWHGLDALQGTRAKPGNHLVYYKSSHALDPRRKQEEGTTKREVEKVRGARDEGSRVELGQIA